MCEHEYLNNGFEFPSGKLIDEVFEGSKVSSSGI